MFEDKDSAKRTFWVLIIGFIISAFLVILNHFLSANLNLFASVLEDATINIEFNKKVNSNDFLICFNNSCKSASGDKNIYYLRFIPEVFNDEFYEAPLSKIRLIYKDDGFIENIENIYLYVGSNSYIYNKNKIRSFEKGSLKIQLDNSKSAEKYSSIVIPNEYKSNYKGILNHICTLFLFTFYGWKNFIIPYLMLFGAICIYIFNRNAINLNVKPNKIHIFCVFSLILALTIILRANLLYYYPLWLDELYVKIIGIKSFHSCFCDPGNPPLYYLVQFFTTKLFGNSYIVLKTTALFIGVLSIPSVYLIFKKYSYKLSLFASFFAAINIIYIYQSGEVRSGALCSVLVLLSIYSLFNYLNKSSNINLLLYSVITICCINTHYYLAILSFCNFLYGLYNLNNKKDKIVFSILNFISAITFIPYLCISFTKAASLSFNGWIGVFDYYKFIYAIREFFLNKYIFLLFAVLILINIIIYCMSDKLRNTFGITVDKNKRQLFFYLLYSILLMLLIISIISLTIKPIFHKRLCLSIYSLFLLLQVLLISSPFKFSTLSCKQKTVQIFISSIIFFICTAITHPMSLNKACRIDEYIDFINNDCETYINDNYEIHAITTDYFDYLYNYPQILNKPIIWHIINGNSGSYITNIDKSAFTKSKKAVIYLNSISVEFKDAVTPKENSYIIRTNSITNAKILYND